MCLYVNTFAKPWERRFGPMPQSSMSCTTWAYFGSLAHSDDQWKRFLGRAEAHDNVLYHSLFCNRKRTWGLSARSDPRVLTQAKG